MESEKYYHSLLRFGMQPGLERISKLLDRLGSPQNTLKFVHVAGTNGKGSVCTFIAGVLSRAGYKTGLYTSPYVIDFRERIRVDGVMIPCGELDGVTLEVSREIESLAAEGVVITEFEAVTAAAFLYYARRKCDVVVLETGLGGRFDATNVITEPVCTCITSVSLDHVKILGGTLEQIAFEKCGIIKPGRPCVTSSDQSYEVLRVIKEQTSDKNSPLIIADTSDVKLLDSGIEGSDVLYKDILIHIPFPGEHQLENAAVALECINVLNSNGFNVSSGDISEGFKSCFIPARCEIISSSPLVILDGCHNDGSTLAFAGLIRKRLKNKKIHALMGMMADKNCEKAIANLVPLFSDVTFVKPSNPRAAEPEKLSELAAKYCADVSTADTVESGADSVCGRLSDGGVLAVCGSLYLASDIREYLIKRFAE